MSVEENKTINNTDNASSQSEVTPINNIAATDTSNAASTETTEAPKPKFNRWQNKHKIPGKHKLKYDSIFKGKKESNENAEFEDSHRSEGFEIDRSSYEWQTKYDFEEYNRLKNLKQEIYDIITDKTEINLKANRRKPGRTDFNNYFAMLVDNLDMSIYSHSEVFIELSYYFSENEYNMFKLLEQKWGTKIVKELSSKYNVNKIDGVDFI